MSLDFKKSFELLHFFIRNFRKKKLHCQTWYGTKCKLPGVPMAIAYFVAGLRIRIQLIRIRIQHFRLNIDPDPDPIRIQSGSMALMTKN